MKVTLYEWKMERIGEVELAKLPIVQMPFEHAGKSYRIEGLQFGYGDGSGVAIELLDETATWAGSGKSHD